MIIIRYLKDPAPLSSIESIQDEVFFDYTSPTVSHNNSDTERGISLLLILISFDLFSFIAITLFVFLKNCSALFKDAANFLLEKKCATHFCSCSEIQNFHFHFIFCKVID